eukprot:gene21742-27664_t
MACGATYALVPFIDRRALGGVAGIIGAGGNVGAVLAGFLFKGLGDTQQTLSVLGVLVAVSALCAIAENRIMNIIIIGHGMVGHKFLECLAESGATDLHVTILCEEPRPAYDRVHLSEFFAGKTAQDLSLVAPGFFDAGKSSVQFDLKLNAKAQAIDL